ncbi:MULTISPECIES: (deoxy)nucleoside triphosphate pyrophosphohydrolase [unclassified Sphingomonas]|uniref:(deoxy)nucleoside triphosphate pyrophosphohydrolase n=1 Tax=unclassified Sphingomonas TaxID=196159 RepID=UPI0023E1BD7B|nr:MULTISPECIES: (deoxy)nucleoside triphosphate pyrophosphohydrolase [unclassified Sphingomonas]
MADTAVMFATLLPVVAAALIDDEGRVLLQRRPDGKELAGLWEFPGGKIEPGERPEAALVRELGEELGIVVDVADLTPVAFASADLGRRHLLLLLYAVSTWRGVPQALEASELCWARPEDMAGLAMPPADVPLVEALLRRKMG